MFEFWQLVHEHQRTTAPGGRRWKQDSTFRFFVFFRHVLCRDLYVVEIAQVASKSGPVVHDVDIVYQGHGALPKPRDDHSVYSGWRGAAKPPGSKPISGTIMAKRGR
jgi:hypothetical protein